MPGTGADTVPVQQAEKDGAMQDLVITTFLGPGSGTIQGSDQIVLGDRFHIMSPGERSLLKSLAVKSHQSFGICDQPGLHRLHHEMTVFLRQVWNIPTVLSPKMVPARQSDPVFRVDQQDVEGVGIAP